MTRRPATLAAAVALVALLLSVAWLRRDPYASRRGVRGVPEFVGQPISFAVSRLGQPTRSIEFTLAHVGGEMPRANLKQLEPPLAENTRVRELNWDKGHTFVTVWYRAEVASEVGVDAVQWDKRMATWGATMAKSPTAASQPAP